MVLTKNEEKNIEKCLESISFCDEVIIVDDNSHDKTIEKAKKVKGIKNLKVLSRILKGDFAQQRNFGLEKATGDWVLFIDADERVSGELKKEILDINQSKDAYFIKRRDFFWGKQLKHGEVAPVLNQGLVRLVKKDSGRWMGDVHEVFHTARVCGTLEGFINHYPHPSIKEFISDINNYSTLRANELYNQGKKTNTVEIMFLPVLKFILNFVIRLGFLDGTAGFTYALMMSFHSFLVRSKLYQLRSL